MSESASINNASSLQALMGTDEEVVVLNIGEGENLKEVKFHLKAPKAMEVAAIGDKYKLTPQSKAVDIEIIALCLRIPPETFKAHALNDRETDKLLVAAYRLAGQPDVAEAILKAGEAEKKSRLQQAADKGVTLGPGATTESDDSEVVEEPNPLSSK